MARKHGARTRRAARIAAVLPITAKLVSYQHDIDSSWMTRRASTEDRSYWYVTPFSRTRDAGATEESNYNVAYQAIESAAGMETSVRRDLWSGGWVDSILVRRDDAFALREVQRLIWRLEEHSILDEDDLTAVQWEHDHPTSTECYSERGNDCTCDVAERRRQVAKHSCDDEFVVTLWAKDDKEEQSEIVISPIEGHQFWCGFCERWMDLTFTMEGALVRWAQSDDVRRALALERENRRNGQTTLV